MVEETNKIRPSWYDSLDLNELERTQEYKPPPRHCHGFSRKFSHSKVLSTVHEQFSNMALPAWMQWCI